jgi:hypothetical protein
MFASLENVCVLPKVEKKKGRRLCLMLSYKQSFSFMRIENMQKRLVLCILQELHVVFCHKYITVSVGFLKFADLYPKHCFHAGTSWPHAVCVMIHQKISLTLQGEYLLANSM